MSINKKNTQPVSNIADSLGGKTGWIRRHCLGKRADFSARSVIIPNPNLLIDQVGVPIRIALNLFEPLVIRALIDRRLAFTIKEARKLISEEGEEISKIINEIVVDRTVIVNRNPTLHRPSIQAFYIVLTWKNTIELHTSKVAAFNADFDGDNVSIYAQTTREEEKEAKELMISSNHIVDPKNGFLIDMPTQEVILGLYYLSLEKKQGDLKIFFDLASLKRSYQDGSIDLHELLIVPTYIFSRPSSVIKGKFLITTYGKIVFDEILPSNFPFYLNDLNDYIEGKNSSASERLIEAQEVEKSQTKNLNIISGWKKKLITNFLNKLVSNTARKEMVVLLDKIKELGFHYATKSGISISPFEVNNGIFPKQEELSKARKEIKNLQVYYEEGLYSKEALKRRKNQVWENLREELQNKLISYLNSNKSSSLYYIWDSGARASSENLTQILILRGLAINYEGKIIDYLIDSSLWEGLNPFQFAVSVRTAMRLIMFTSVLTGKIGSWTRRLLKALQEIIIKNEDCGTKLGIKWEKKSANDSAQTLYGKFISEDLIDEQGGIIFKRNTLLLNDEILLLGNKNVRKVHFRSPLTCESFPDLCQMCYGTDLSKPGIVAEIGTPVGSLAAQSLGEPCTQLSMVKTSGVSGTDDIGQGFPKIEKIINNVKPTDDKALIAKNDGKITYLDDKIIKQTSEKGEETIYSLSKNQRPIVNLNEFIAKGERVTSGRVDYDEYLKIVGWNKSLERIRDEISVVYSNQSITINGKHFEILVRQLLSKVKIDHTGDSNLFPGEIIEYGQLKKINEQLALQNKQEVKYQHVISSLNDLASQTDSFLSAISFQNTIRALVLYLVFKPDDNLNTFEGSLISGQIIPTGQGYLLKKKLFKEAEEKLKK